jgi:hypothetical protein
MERLEVSGVVRHIYVIRRLKVNQPTISLIYTSLIQSLFTSLFLLIRTYIIKWRDHERKQMHHLLITLYFISFLQSKTAISTVLSKMSYVCLNRQGG